MQRLKNFNDYKAQIMNESKSETIKLDKEEKEFLWSKMESKKKKKAEDTESDIYKMLNGKKPITSEEEFINILNTLEYTMKKRIRSGTAPRGKFEKVFNSLQQKLPSDWMGIKFSRIVSKKSRDEKAPTDKSLVKDIKKWLDIHNISYNTKDSKRKLLSLVK